MSGAELAAAGIELMAVAVEHGWFERLRNALRHRHRVIVLGSTGVGKTNFLKAIADPLPDAIDAINRSEFAKTHKLSIAKQPFDFVDTPGQRLHNTRLQSAIREEIRQGPVGVLTLNAFGYHEYGLGRSAAIDHEGNADEDFLRAHREIEIDFTRAWVPLLADSSTTRFLINVVSKADLWWDKRDEVIKHYQSGPYYQALGDAKSLNPVTTSFCSVIHRFYRSGPVSGHFDDTTRKTLRVHVFQTLLEAVGQ